MRHTWIIGLLVFSSCAPLPHAERARRDATDQANVHCEGYASASRTPLGTATDIIAIKRAVKSRTGQDVIGDIRWLSTVKVLVPLDHGCCEVTRSKNGKWIVTDFPTIIGVT
jgi:hypothetical protein